MKAGWKVRPLGKVCELIKRGIAPKYVETGGIVVINQKCIRNHEIDFALARRNDLEKKTVPDERLIKLGDVLVNSTGTGTLGRVAQVRMQEKFDATVDTHVTIVRPIAGKFYLPFFGYMMRMIEDEIKDAGQGVGGQTELSRDALTNSFSVSYPDDLEEQKRIVAVLDAAFEGLTRAKENAEANLQNARELFGAFLEELFLKHGEKWSTAPLQDTVTEDCTLSYGIVQPGDDVEGGLLVVRPTDLGKPLITKVGLKTIAPEKADGYARTKLVGDEILLCVRGTTGVVAKALPELKGGNVTRGIVPIRFNPEKMLQDFGYYQFRSRHIQEQIEAQTYGAALRQINIRDLRKLNFVFPDVLDQENLLPFLQDAQRSCEELVETNLSKLADIADLRQSLLQKAFAGELT